MQHDGWLETILHARFPEARAGHPQPRLHRRRATTRLRSKNFGTPDEWLSGTATRSAATRTTASRRPTPRPTSSSPSSATTSRSPAKPGSTSSRQHLDDFIKHTLAQKYNGKSRAAPGALLADRPRGSAATRPARRQGEQRSGSSCTRAPWPRSPRRSDVTFVDLFAPTCKLYAERQGPLTINGIHLNSEGNRRLARGRSTAPCSASRRSTRTALPRPGSAQAVVDKNFYWFNRYRTTDGYSIYGGRAFLKFVRGNPRNVNATRWPGARRTSCRPTTKCSARAGCST